MHVPSMSLPRAVGASDVLAVTQATMIGFYLVYAFIAVGLVVFLARILSRNGEVFLEEAFDRPEVASSVNQLLVIGFYLLNMGYALLVYRVVPDHEMLISAFSDLMVNIGILMASLGVLHLFNMAVLWRIGGRSFRRTEDTEVVPPYVAPPSFRPPPPPPPVPVGSGAAGDDASQGAAGSDAGQGDRNDLHR